MTNKEEQVRERNLELYARVVAGDLEATNEMAELNMPYVVWLANEFLEQHPDCEEYREDFISDGYVGMIQAIHRMQAAEPREDANPTHFIGQAVLWAFQVTIKQVFHDIDHDQDNITDEIRLKFGGPSTRMYHMDILPELLEEMLACCQTELECEIVRLRANNHSNLSITKILEVPEATVRYHLGLIEERYALRKKSQ